MRPWGVHTIHNMFGGPGVQAGLPDGRWVTAVCEPYVPGFVGRLRTAWWVFTGRAHAVIWPEHGDLEAALGIARKLPKKETNV